MGVRCEIKIINPANGLFIPGRTVSGVIKYTIDKEKVFTKITVSIRGSGWLSITDERKNRNNDNSSVYTTGEKYVDIKNVIYRNDKAEPSPVGVSEVPFNFTLPQNMPPSFNYHNADLNHRVICKIKYYIGIKFSKPGHLKIADRLKKEIIVLSAVKARLPREPTIYSEQKKTMRLCCRKHTIAINAIIQSCVIAPSSKVELTCEIFNHTNSILKSVDIKLMEEYTFYRLISHNIILSKYVEGIDHKTGVIKSGGSTRMDVTFDLPPHTYCLDYSNLVSRNLLLLITANIPLPHFGARLAIPIQIGYTNETNVSNVDDNNPPLSYWEVMAEDKNPKSGDNEDW